MAFGSPEKEKVRRCRRIKTLHRLQSTVWAPGADATDTQPTEQRNAYHSLMLCINAILLQLGGSETKRYVSVSEFSKTLYAR